MDVAKSIKDKAKKLLEEGKAYVYCEPIEDQPGRFICYGRVQNEDGRTYQEGSLIVRIEDEGNNVKIEALPASTEGGNNNTLVQHIILQHLKSLYNEEED